jgi:2-C-methyl-D-erythritol 2,4-cyclodiphosphate synthase
MFRIGQGLDIHPVSAGRRLILGGVPIPWEHGLDGHSDADVLLHAVTDAVLGALAAGDIGQWFPPGDDRFRGADSADLLRHVLASPSARGWRLVNLDSTVIAEAPRLAPHIAAIQASLARLFVVESSQVSVKATTSEALGFTGRGEGMAALAVVLLSNTASSAGA